MASSAPLIGSRFRLTGLTADTAPPRARATHPNVARTLAAAVVVALTCLYAFLLPGHFRGIDLHAHHADQYNLLTDGILAGHLYLNEPLPPGLLELADPYNPATNGTYRYQYGLWDQSFYEGKCYLYFGVTPVVSLFLPFRLLSGGLRMPTTLAALIFTVAALLFATGALFAIRRRYFPEVPTFMVLAGVSLIGTGNVACYLLSQSNIYQVAIACGMCFSGGAFYFLTRAFERTPRRWLHLFAAGVFLALAVGSRPHFAATGVIAFGIAVVALWRRGDVRPSGFLALTVPFALGGVFLALYNFFRFGSFLEFGARYQLTIIDMRTGSMFGASHVPSTLYFMFLQPPTLNKQYPYIHPMPKLPGWLTRPDGFLLERVTGLFTSTPFLWVIFFAALAAILRPRRGAAAKPFPTLELLWIGTFVAVVVAVLSMTGGTMRYLGDFATLLDLGALVSWFYLDQRLAAAPRARAISRGLGVALILVGAVIGPALALPPPSHYMDGLGWGRSLDVVGAPSELSPPCRPTIREQKAAPPVRSRPPSAGAPTTSTSSGATRSMRSERSRR